MRFQARSQRGKKKALLELYNFDVAMGNKKVHVFTLYSRKGLVGSIIAARRFWRFCSRRRRSSLRRRASPGLGGRRHGRAPPARRVVQLPALLLFLLEVVVHQPVGAMAMPVRRRAPGRGAAPGGGRRGGGAGRRR